MKKHNSNSPQIPDHHTEYCQLEALDLEKQMHYK